MYGAFKDAFDYLYDPQCTYKTTINLQLYLLILVEALEIEGIHVISANTDGIVCLFDESLEAKYKEVCAWWEKTFAFDLEYTDYEKYIRSNVNSYIAIKKGFYAELEDKTFGVRNDAPIKKSLERKYVKLKGMFVDEPDFSKGFINPVVSTAVRLFYIYDTPILKTFKKVLKQPNGIYEFCISQKIDKKFKAQYHSIENGRKKITPLQQYNRFYVSSSNTGNILKFDPDKRKYVSIVAKQNLRILNVYRDEIITDVKFSYYLEEADKIITGNKKKAGISDNKLQFEFANEIPIFNTATSIKSMYDEFNIEDNDDDVDLIEDTTPTYDENNLDQLPF
jgi:hypothetical protein